MPKLLTDLLQHTGYTMYQSLVFFALAYAGWFLCKKIAPKAISASQEYFVLWVLLLTGTIHFLITLFQYKTLQYSGFLQSTDTLWLRYIAIGFGIWYCITVLTTLYHFIQNQHNQKDPSMQAYTAEEPNAYIAVLCAYLKIKKPQIYLSSKKILPYTSGLFKKIIVLPVAFMNQLNEQELEAVILHELAHIKRADHLTNRILFCTTVLVGFNPFAKILIKQAKLQRELACDDWVLQQNIRPNYYARALQKAAMLQYTTVPLQLAMGVPQQDLLYRIQRLFKQETNTRFSFQWLPFLSFAFFLFFPSAPKPTNIEQQRFGVVIFQQPLEETYVKNAIKNKTAYNPLPIPQLTATKAALSKEPTEDNNLIQNLIPVANTETPEFSCTIVNNTNAKINDNILALNDSVIVFQELLTRENVNEATSIPLSGLLHSIAMQEENADADLALVSAPSKLTVTQNGEKNLFYNNVQLQQNTVYDAGTRRWKIVFTLTNNKSVIAKRFVTVLLVKKLQSISL